MKVTGSNGNTLVINADTTDDTLVFYIEGYGLTTVRVPLSTFIATIPVLAQVQEALKESARLKKIARKETIEEQIVVLQAELAEIEILTK